MINSTNVWKLQSNTFVCQWTSSHKLGLFSTLMFWTLARRLRPRGRRLGEAHIGLGFIFCFVWLSVILLKNFNIFQNFKLLMERSLNFSSLNFIGQFGLSNCMFGLPQPPDFFLHPVQRFLAHLVVMDVESDPGHGNFHSAVLTNIGVTVYSSAESVTNYSPSLTKICILSKPYTLFK